MVSENNHLKIACDMPEQKPASGKLAVIVIGLS
jgi:hypothetical protein